MVTVITIVCYRKQHKPTIILLTDYHELLRNLDEYSLDYGKFDFIKDKNVPLLCARYFRNWSARGSR